GEVATENADLADFAARLRRERANRTGKTWSPSHHPCGALGSGRRQLAAGYHFHRRAGKVKERRAARRHDDFHGPKQGRALYPCAAGNSDLSPGLRDGLIAKLRQLRRVRLPFARRLQLVLGRAFIQARGRNRPAGEDRNHIVGHLHKAAINVVLGGAPPGGADPHLPISQPADHRAVAGGNADLSVIERQRDKLRILLQGGIFGRDDDAVEEFGHWGYFFWASFLACSSACSIGPTYMNASSGKWSHLPLQISSKLRMVSATLVYSPLLPVKTSATKNGWERKRSMRRARCTTSLSSSESSSTPRMAMMSCNSRYRCKVICTRRATA